MPSTTLLALIILVATLLPATTACSMLRLAATPPGTDQSPIRLALPPRSTPDRVLAHGTPLARLVERETGLRIAISVPTSQATAVDALGTSSLDAAWLSPFAYLAAAERAGADVLLGSARGGSSVAVGEIVVQADTARPSMMRLTEPIPRDALAVRAALPAETKATLRDGLLRAAMTDEGRRLVGQLFDADGLAPLTDADFDPARKAARSLDLSSDWLLTAVTWKPDRR